ncbi:MAG TPA: alpha/beta hydrolase, partial [Cellulomonadaceae bacterium]|nr:alpha/beta hydrolase [Cellulomonadaceae bacterium]
VRGLALLDTRSGSDGADAATGRLRVAETVIREGSVDAVRPMATTLLGGTSRTTREGLVEQLAGWIDDQRPDGVAWSQRAMAARPDRSAALRRFTGPALVLVGDEDAVTPVETARAMHDDLVGSTLVVVPQAGHMTAVESPEPVADALADLAARVDSR